MLYVNSCPVLSALLLPKIFLMSVNICRSREFAVSESFLNFFHRHVVREQ